MYCENCKQECGITEIDMSFDHEFGTQKETAYGSECCEAEMYDCICDSCLGSGLVDDKICDECDGIGLLNRVNGHEMFELIESKKESYYGNDER